MTSREIRQSFLDFFKSKQHTIVPSSSLMPDSPNLLFTNAGMNQFVPIFLGQAKCPYTPGRAADTQKCIRAGGKHNDLEDVGLDTYHHTFFEMLGNWSFGDYFKKEAIEWAWELVVGIWKFPANRVYATVYKPGPNDPAEFDQEAYDLWSAVFTAAGLDPKVHIVFGNKKDNFWMMGETGPCGPCSELHVDLTPNGDTQGTLVNKGSAQCIEIWNLVFMQFNANPDGTYSPLPAKSVDTGMGFERVTGIIQNTKGFKDFSRTISNYETDIFRPIFDQLEKMSGKKYASTLPKAGSTGDTGQEKIDVAFRVIADHIRTLSFSIADGIQPGNNDRNYVLRRILRRAVSYGRNLGFCEPFFYKLVDVLATTMGDIFPEIRIKQSEIKTVIKREEVAFNKTLDRGMELFETRIKEQPIILQIISDFLARNIISELRTEFRSNLPDSFEAASPFLKRIAARLDAEVLSNEASILKQLGGVLKSVTEEELQPFFKIAKYYTEIERLAKGKPSDTQLYHEFLGRWEEPLLKFENDWNRVRSKLSNCFLPGYFVFKLYGTYGFPLDLTELKARERGFKVDVAGYNELMEEERERARKAQKKEIIELSQIQIHTNFVGYNQLHADCFVKHFATRLRGQGKVPDYFAIVDQCPLYAEMGGQAGDTGFLDLTERNETIAVLDTIKQGDAFLLKLDPGRCFELEQLGVFISPGEQARLRVDAARRRDIQRHHTVTHLLHWAIHEVVSPEASQKGSFVGPDKLTFDFNCAPLTPQQTADVEKLVNERILENAGVSWTEMPYAEVKGRKDVMQFFGDKYGEVVRVVQIGGKAAALDGYSMELCGGTHTRATGEIGLFRIVAETAIAAGVRRIEAVAGLESYRRALDELQLIKSLAGKVNSPINELEKKVENLVAQQKELEKQLRALSQKQAAENARGLVAKAKTLNGIPAIIERIDADGDTLQAMANELKGLFKGVVVLGGAANNAVALVASVSPEFTAKVQAGKLIQQTAPIVGGKGGGKPDNARGGGKDAGKLDEALSKAASLI